MFLWLVLLLRLRNSEQQQRQLTLEQLRQEFAAQAAVRTALRDGQPAWLGYRHFLVARKIKDGPTSDSYYLVPEDGRPLAAFRPGQYVTVRARLRGQAPHENEIVERRYPITCEPNDEFYCISVEQIPDPLLSGCLHAGITAGTAVDVQAPRGELCLESQRLRPIVLVADGVGREPCITMLEAATESNPDRPVTVVYGVRDGRDYGIRERLQQLSMRLPRLTFIAVEGATDGFDSMASGRFDFAGSISIDAVRSVLPTLDVDIQLWGPALMVESLQESLVACGVSELRIQAVVFGPPHVLPPAVFRQQTLSPVQSSDSTRLAWKPATEQPGRTCDAPKRKRWSVFRGTSPAVALRASVGAADHTSAG